MGNPGFNRDTKALLSQVFPSIIAQVAIIVLREIALHLEIQTERGPPHRDDVAS